MVLTAKAKTPQLIIVIKILIIFSEYVVGDISP